MARLEFVGVLSKVQGGGGQSLRNPAAILDMPAPTSLESRIILFNFWTVIWAPYPPDRNDPGQGRDVISPPAPPGETVTLR
ncbi:hypothetical protein E2C01_076334 [Portunus trituberculatus]|uniref:Uncharacterized protein n=1 Tax=Portunus trituberculatus TaxID=210409 RepID=A0A5B7ID10_PORTR|nr:hypothetical protein [Portunus trituberculatus]